MQPFSQSWDRIIQFAKSETHVRTIFHGNRNEICVVGDAVEVENINTQTRRTIEKQDFRYAYRLLVEKGELSLDDIEPELAGRKSIVLAILGTALDLETKQRPVTIYAD